MNACDTNEIALERMAAGDLPEDEIAQLEAHLAGCSTCQRYNQQMERMQTMIQTSNATVDVARTWRRVNKYVVRREEKTQRRLTLYIPLSMFFMSIPLIISLIEGPQWWTLFAVGFMLTCVAQIVALMARQRQLKRLVDSPRDLLTVVRRELSLKLLFAGSGVFFAALLGVIWIGTGLETPPAWMPTLGYGGGGPFYFGMAAVFFGYAVYLLVVTLPRLRRMNADFE